MAHGGNVAALRDASTVPWWEGFAKCMVQWCHGNFVAMSVAPATPKEGEFAEGMQ